MHVYRDTRGARIGYERVLLAHAARSVGTCRATREHPAAQLDGLRDVLADEGTRPREADLKVVETARP